MDRDRMATLALTLLVGGTVGLALKAGSFAFDAQNEKNGGSGPEPEPEPLAENAAPVPEEPEPDADDTATETGEPSASEASEKPADSEDEGHGEDEDDDKEEADDKDDDKEEDDDDDEVEIEGRPSAIDARNGTFVIRNPSDIDGRLGRRDVYLVLTTKDTEYEVKDKDVSRSEFFKALTPECEVEAEGHVMIHILLADEVEIEDD